MHRFPKFMQLIGLVVASAILVGCGGDDGGADGAAADPPAAEDPAEDDGADGDDTGGDTTDDLQTLRVGTMAIAGTFLLHAADDLGFFADHGLDVEIDIAGSGAELLPALEAGSIDIAYSNSVSPLQAMAQGFDFQIVLDNGKYPASPPDNNPVIVPVDSPIEEPADLIGTQVAVPSVGGLNDGFLMEYLRREGLDHEAVTFVEVPFANMIDALAQGSVDAAVVVEPVTTIALGTGNFRELVSIFSEVVPDLTLAGWYAKEAWLSTPDGEDLTTRFVAAMEDARLYVLEDEEEELRLVEEWSSLERGLVEQVLEADVTERTGTINRASLEQIVEIFGGLELLSGDVDVDDHLWEHAAVE